MSDGWLSGRSVLAFAGGTVTALLAGSMLRPQLGRAVGLTRAAMGGDPFEALATEHRTVLAMLQQAERSASPLKRTQLIALVKRALTAHALAEEDVLYPLLHEHAGEKARTRQLYAEHAEIKIHLHALEQLPKNAPEWTGRVRELRRTLEHHIQEEESEFPALRRLLDERGMARLSGDLDREKAMVL